MGWFEEGFSERVRREEGDESLLLELRSVVVSGVERKLYDVVRVLKRNRSDCNHIIMFAL